MTPINNSDTAWLIVSDYNQENGKYYDELREDVLNPEVNLEDGLIRNCGRVVGCIVGVGVGGNDVLYPVSDAVGSFARGLVGTVAGGIGGVWGTLSEVGGNSTYSPN